MGETVSGTANDESDPHDNGAKQETGEAKPGGPGDAHKDSERTDPHPKKQKRDWVDYGTLLALAATFLAACYAGYEADRLANLTQTSVSDARENSTKQDTEIAASAVRTEKAIAATNRIAEEAARATSESHRLADAAAQSAAESRRLADEAAKTAVAAAQANDLTRQLTREAAKANEISHQALIGVQRAFMFAHGAATEDIRMGTLGQTAVMAWRANLQWENSGNTPTKDLVITTYCVTSFNVLEDPFTILITDPHNQYLTNQDFPTVF